ncbi:MAG: ABC transporter permease [Cyclobacteriaceae bacterium]
MNLPLFISKRISSNSDGSFSTVISRIAVISIAVAIIALICAFTILGGFENTIKEKIYTFSGHLVVSKYTLSTSYEDSPIDVSDSVLSHIESLPGIDYLQTYAYKAGLLKANEEVQGVILKGLDQNFDTVSFSDHLIKGRFPTFPDEGYGQEVAISSKMARYLKLDIGDEMIIFFIQEPPRFRKLILTGIYETGLEDFDEKTILGDINLVRRINGWERDKAAGIEVFLKDVENLEAAEDLIFNETGNDLYVDKVSDKYAGIFDWLSLLHRNVIIFFWIILFIASLNMISILLILIMERIQMIGTFKALGATGGLLRRVFLFNGLLLITKGLFWGNLISLGVCWIQYQFKVMPLDVTSYYMSHVPISFDLNAIILINVLAVVIVGLTLFLPLLVISRIKPIVAIRFD